MKKISLFVICGIIVVYHNVTFASIDKIYKGNFNPSKKSLKQYIYRNIFEEGTIYFYGFEQDTVSKKQKRNTPDSTRNKRSKWKNNRDTTTNGRSYDTLNRKRNKSHRRDTLDYKDTSDYKN